MAFDDEFQFVTFQGRRIWVCSIRQAAHNASGVITGVHGAFQDITEKTRVEEALNQSNQRLTSTLESITDAFFTLNHDWRFQLKIDRSFIRDVLTNPDDAVIARMVVTLGQSLGLVVIAEGVETEAQRDFLARHGCHHYQGYLFSRPLPAEQFQAFMQHSNRTSA